MGRLNDFQAVLDLETGRDFPALSSVSAFTFSTRGYTSRYWALISLLASSSAAVPVKANWAFFMR